MPRPDINACSAILARFRAQEVLFAATVSRPDLLALDLAEGPAAAVEVNVWRNQNFETVEGLMRPFLAYAGLRMDCRIGAYDDMLGFEGWEPAQAEVLWLDSLRYTDLMTLRGWLDWLRRRLLELRDRTSAPILLATWDAWRLDGAQRLAAMAADIPRVHFADLGAACADEKVELLDRRAVKQEGASMSRAAQAVLARKAGCQWLPGMLMPSIKAVVVNLDNTLHAGTLDRDGPGGVQPGPGQLAFQKALRALRERGVFLALVSHSEREDIETLFADRMDYPLRWSDFSVVKTFGESKADALAEVIRQLRVAADSVLFMGDDPAELACAAAACPGLRTVFADAGKDGTSALRYFPGLWRWPVSIDEDQRWVLP